MGKNYKKMFNYAGTYVKNYQDCFYCFWLFALE